MSMAPLGGIEMEADNLLQWRGPRVKNIQLQRNHVDDTVELAVVHTLFRHQDLYDDLYKKLFRGRFLEAILANGAPDGRALIVERRAMAARAQRARKAKAVRS